MYKTILVPIDRANAERAAPMINIAKSALDKDGKIILLTVIEPIPTWVTNSLPEDVIGRSHEQALEELNIIENQALIEATKEVKVGYPYKTILETAREENVDLIIIASHKPDIGDYLLGSTASKVVRHAKCSVLVTR